MESDNRALKLAINDMQEKLSRQVALNESLKAELRLLKSHVGRQLMDWKKMEEKLADLINSGNTSTTNPSSWSFTVDFIWLWRSGISQGRRPGKIHDPSVHTWALISLNTLLLFRRSRKK